MTMLSRGGDGKEESDRTRGGGSGQLTNVCFCLVRKEEKEGRREEKLRWWCCVVVGSTRFVRGGGGGASFVE